MPRRWVVRRYVRRGSVVGPSPGSVRIVTDTRAVRRFQSSVGAPAIRRHHLTDTTSRCTRGLACARSPRVIVPAANHGGGVCAL
jgi:hypothetical protein